MPSVLRLRCLGLGLPLLAALGCGPSRLPDYLVYRYRDACGVVDLGMTVSTTPHYALYIDILSVLPVGACDVEGEFMGLGRHQVGILRWYERNWGVGLYGRESLGWGDDYNPDNPETLSEQSVGLVGLFERSRYRRPGSVPSLMSAIHVAHVGFVANAHLAELLDFLTGWFGYDLCRDDGRKFGRWPSEPSEPVGDEDDLPPTPAAQPVPPPKAGGAPRAPDAR